MAREKKLFDMVCSLCGVEDSVPFKPREDTLCRKCHGHAKIHIPRKRHNTRVSFPITCSSCGTYEVLTYRPKVSLLSVLCTTCMKGHVSPDSTWADIQGEEKRMREREEMRARFAEMERADGEEEEVIVDGSKDALAGAHSLGQSVYIRTKSTSAESASTESAPTRSTPAKSAPTESASTEEE